MRFVFAVLNGAVTVAGVLLASAVAAQRPEELPSHGGTGALTLSQAVAEALARSPDLALAAPVLRAATARLEQAGLRPAPQLLLELEDFAGSGAFKGTESAQTTLALSQILELGDRRGRRVDAARAGLELLTVEQQARALDVLAEVSRRFIHVAADQDHLRLTQQGTELAQQTVAAVTARVKAAKSPEAELHRARITLARAEVEREHAEHELLSSRRALAAMWGDTQLAAASVSADLYALPAAGDFDALLLRLQNNPDFTRFASQARLRDAEIRLARSRRLGDIQISAGVRRLEARDNQAFIAGISVPLFSGRQAAAAITEAEALRNKTDAEERAARIKAQAQLFELHQELRHAITEATVLRDRVLPEMDEALRETKYAYERGRYSYLEWVEAQREFIAVRRSLIEAAASAHNYRTEIERLTGEPLATTQGN